MLQEEALTSFALCDL